MAEIVAYSLGQNLYMVNIGGIAAIHKGDVMYSMRGDSLHVSARCA